jgi:hypothetical protein
MNVLPGRDGFGQTDRIEMLHSPYQHRPPTKLVWLWFMVTLSLGLAGFLLFMRNVDTPTPASWGADDGLRNEAADWFNSLQQALLLPVTVSALGALILIRRPGHRIGRLLIAIGLSTALGHFTQEWAVYGYYTVKADLPGAALAAWITNWLWIVIFGLMLLTAALFPNGNFASHRWGRLIRVLLILFVFPALIKTMLETPMASAFQIPNPFTSTQSATFYDFPITVAALFQPVTAVAVLISTGVRFRASRDRERQQMKWLLVGVALMATLIVAGLGLQFGPGRTLGAILVNAAGIGPALGVGVALLRHQLYDVDVIIRRTLVYSTLSGLLAMTYFSVVVILQSLFRAFTSQSENQLITVASTLAIAALFFPLRNRVQAVIDRRFYRQKYDAQKVLAEFAATARDETDLDKLTARLVEVVDETMQPEKVSLWLKPEPRTRERSQEGRP